MKKSKYLLPGKVLVAIMFIVSVSGCTKDLDLSPTDALSDATFWRGSDDFRLAANRFYDFLPGQGFQDLNSDINYGNSPNAVSNGTNTLPDNDGRWDGAYANILAMNKLLEEASNYEGTEDISRWVAEAKFFRAMMYLNLVTTFGDVPYVDKPLSPSSEELQASRDSREVVIANVLQDLREAAPDLPLQSELPGDEFGRITRGAANALRARASLFEGTWVKYHGTSGNANSLLDEAISAAEAVISSGEYDLFRDANNPELSYFNSYMLPGNDSQEQILARRYHPDVQGHAHGHWLCCGGSADATKKLADMYVCTDGLPISESPLFQGYTGMATEFQNRDNRMSNTIMIPGTNQVFRNNQDGSSPIFPRITGDEETGYRVNKLVSNDPDGFVWGRNHEFKHILKYSEVLLTLAEALYERNGAISDTDLERTINQLRDRAGVADLTNALVAGNSLNMLEELRRERTVELAYDGHRLNDLRRWKTAVAELGEAIRGVQVGNGAWDGQFPGISTNPPSSLDANGFLVIEPAADRNFSEKNYLFPVPAQQIQLNPNLNPQNTGW